MTYKLSDKEKAALTTIKDQISEKQKELVALSGGVNGMLLLIATQQLGYTGKETLSMPDDHTLTLEPADQSPED